jgi:hypothetical protein
VMFVKGGFARHNGIVLATWNWYDYTFCGVIYGQGISFLFPLMPMHAQTFWIVNLTRVIRCTMETMRSLFG